jgi:predicted transcriptional regulator
LREYLEREEERVRRLEDTKAALAEAKAGDLINGDDVLSWQDTWGT